MTTMSLSGCGWITPEVSFKPAEKQRTRLSEDAKRAADATQRETDRMNASWDRFITNQDAVVAAMNSKQHQLRGCGKGAGSVVRNQHNGYGEPGGQPGSRLRRHDGVDGGLRASTCKWHSQRPRPTSASGRDFDRCVEGCSAALGRLLRSSSRRRSLRPCRPPPQPTLQGLTP